MNLDDQLSFESNAKTVEGAGKILSKFRIARLSLLTKMILLFYSVPKAKTNLLQCV